MRLQAPGCAFRQFPPDRAQALKRVMSTHGYPRPQLERGNWICLNGTWDFAIDPEGCWSNPQSLEWRERIEVPFAPETPRSGIGNTSLFRACWYRRQFAALPLKRGERLILHMGAVDYAATIWI